MRTDGVHPASIGDDHLGGYLATRKLIDHGHRRIGLITGPDYATTAVQRRNGYRAALTEAGIPLDESLIAGDAYTMEAGEAAARILLEVSTSARSLLESHSLVLPLPNRNGRPHGGPTWQASAAGRSNHQQALDRIHRDHGHASHAVWQSIMWLI